MRNLLILIATFFLMSCSNSEVETLKAENEALKETVQKCQQIAEQAAKDAREAEARAMIALEQAEFERQNATKALEDCKGK